MLDSTPNRVWQTVVYWLGSQHGWEEAKQAVQWVEVPGAGRGLLVDRDVELSSSVLEIPPKALLHIRNIHLLSALPASLLPSYLSPTILSTSGLRTSPRKRLKVLHEPTQGTAEPDLTSVQLLSLYLAIHRPSSHRQGAQQPHPGPWAAYLPSLPESFRPWHPLTWLVRPPNTSGSHLERWQTMNALAESRLAPGAKHALRLVWERWIYDLRLITEKLSALEAEERTGLGLGSLLGEDEGLEEDLLWGWLNVNTRAVYIDLSLPPATTFQPASPATAEQNNLTLCPVLDLANHCHSSAPNACSVNFFLSEQGPKPTGPARIVPRAGGGGAVGGLKKLDWRRLGLRITGPANAGLKSGDEIIFPYGSHSDETLFAEYGFVPLSSGHRADEEIEWSAIGGSSWAEVRVDEWVEAEFEKLGKEDGPGKRMLLESLGYWGDYTLHPVEPPAHPSYRLILALRLLHLTLPSTAISAHLASPYMPSSDRSLASFLRVIAGETSVVSAENEAAMRRSLIDCCDSLIKASEEALVRLEASEAEMPDPEVGGWKDCKEAVKRMWTSQSMIAERVRQSVLHNVEF